MIIEELPQKVELLRIIEKNRSDIRSYPMPVLDKIGKFERFVRIFLGSRFVVPQMNKMLPNELYDGTIHEFKFEPASLMRTKNSKRVD